AGADVSKAMLAEQMYLDIRVKLNEAFKQNWENADYDKIIEYLQNIQERL
ncbi:MAG: hypothetical protein GX808_14005, partial [Syntrophomonadaceae bacterium]|nr:hypothetical protein [Syntrophomonadaceae bacterium]